MSPLSLELGGYVATAVSRALGRMDMTLKFMGKKLGMTRIFDEKGNHIVCSVISAEPNVITQLKSKEGVDGYEAVQTGAFQVKPSKVRNVSKPLKGHFAKAGVEPRGALTETRVDAIGEYQVGQVVGVEGFAGIAFVDVRGVSKGKGHQGVIKRHNFAGGPAAHGSGFHRHGGSCGMRSTPGRCLPGQKKSGHMGAEWVSVQNLRVVKVDAENKILLVEGAIPGARGCLLYVSPAIKKKKQ